MDTPRELTPLEEMERAIDAAQHEIAAQEVTISRLASEPFIFGIVVEVRDGVTDPTLFRQGDLVSIIDPAHPEYRKCGRIFDPPDSEGYIHLKITGGDMINAAIGLSGKDKAQVKLIGKDDGTSITVQTKDEIFQVRAVPNVTVSEGSCVRLNADSKQIIDIATVQPNGDVATVQSRLDNGKYIVEVEGKSRVVFPGAFKEILDAGTSVLLDVANKVIVGVVPAVGQSLWHIDESVNVAWSDIGGCKDAKKQLIEAIELPYRHPDLFAHYRKKTPKGICLFGPPGCGKTMLAKAVATSIAVSFGQDQARTGFRIVKGPELLNKYVGNTEANIRMLFAQGEKHWAKWGFPAVLAIDEAESLLSRRGSGISSDMDKTVVNTFLTEMSGVNAMHSIVLLLTNRPDMMDGALRDGRIDRYIKVPRPDIDVVPDILEIHLRDVPLYEVDADKVVSIVASDLFSPSRVLFRVSSPGRDLPPFALADCLNGAMIEGLIDKASSLAIDRDIRNGASTGVTFQDFRKAVDWVYHQNREINHELNIRDFAERHGIPTDDLKVERVFAT